jgi:site-specific DNA-methyltransferase (adenine-specific)
VIDQNYCRRCISIIEPFYSTKLGTLYKGDCLEVMEYLISQGIKVDAIITDPPYAVTGYSWDQLIPFDQMWDKLLKLIKDDGAIVLFGNEPFSSNLRASNPKLYRYDWKWVKTQVTGFQNAKHQPLRCYEDIMVFSKGGCVHQAKPTMCYFPQGIISVNLKVSRSSIDYLSEKKKKEKVQVTQEVGNFPRNVIQFPREATLFHPTQKPTNLMEYLISTYTKENELVLDFTSGSGSTLLGCEVLNRRWIGIEITDKYCNVIKKRLKNGIQLKLAFKYKD